MSPVWLLLTLSVVQILAEDKKTAHKNDFLMGHEVTLKQATFAASNLDIPNLGDRTRIGCATCTLPERLYCESAALLHDHCCCDTKLREPVPFMPHNCHIPMPPDEPCSPMAKNCAEYARIMDCCCKYMLATQSSGPPSWIPFFVGEFFKAWMERRQETNTNNQLEYNPNQEYNQYATLEDDEGHDALVSGSQKTAAGCILLSLVAPLLVLMLTRQR